MLAAPSLELIRQAALERRREPFSQPGCPPQLLDEAPIEEEGRDDEDIGERNGPRDPDECVAALKAGQTQPQVERGQRDHSPHQHVQQTKKPIFSGRRPCPIEHGQGLLEHARI